MIFLDFAKAFITCFLSCSVMAFGVICFSARSYTKSYYWRSFIRMDGGVLWCFSRKDIRASSFPSVYKRLPLGVSCSTELFADDCVLYRKIASEDDCVEFQDDLLSAASWCDLWKVTLKSEKCKVLHVTKSKCPLVHQYVINDNNLSAADKHKHLGIWIESSLGWDSHINFIVGKANRVLGLMRRTFGSKDLWQSKQLLML